MAESLTPRVRWWWLAVLGAMAVVAVLVLRAANNGTLSPSTPGPVRIVSLSPALTETLFAIDAGEKLVGVSDYCDYPHAATTRARTGTSITPNYEAIVRLAPTLIVTESVVNSRASDLSALANTVALPWLSLADVVAGTRRLGALVGREAQANALADRLHRRLSVSVRPHAPRVLLVLGYSAGKLDEVWFVRRNSIHGAALRAAGGQNAVARDVPGQPRLSLEQVIALDPDSIIILLGQGKGSEESIRQQWQAVTPLSAVQHGRVKVLRAPEAFANGPRILALADRLEETLRAFATP